MLQLAVSSLPSLGPRPARQAVRASAPRLVEPMQDEWIKQVLDPSEDDRWALATLLQDEREAADEDRQELTYGEWPLEGFLDALDLAVDGLSELGSLTFCDLGSGTGRLVLAAAARYPWARCIGIEALVELHYVSDSLQAAALEAAEASSHHLSPCEFRALEVSPDTARQQLGEVDVVFVFSTCFDDVTLADTLSAGMKPGARVLTVDALLPNRGDAADDVPSFRLLSQQVAGENTVYLWEVSAERPALWVDYALLQA